MLGFLDRPGDRVFHLKYFLVTNAALVHLAVTHQALKMKLSRILIGIRIIVDILKRDRIFKL